MEKIDLKKIKFVVFDFDGVFTDGKIYYSTQPDVHLKSFCFHDGYGLILLRNSGIKTGLITGHDTPVVTNMHRFIDRFDYMHKGECNKLVILDNWRQELNLEWDQVAFMGDDGPDVECMKICKFSGAPNNATTLAKNVASYICERNGGDSAVREFIDHILKVD